MSDYDLSNMPSYYDAYKAMGGISEIPESYHFWVATSLVAACLTKRVHIKRGASPIYPNLYVVLLGDSGIGKNASIDIGYRLFFRVPELEDPINPNRIASFTGIGIIDLLGEKVDWKETVSDTVAANPIYIITPEMSQALGDINVASSTIKHLTDWYSGEDYNLVDIKRSVGHKTILRGHCFNWIGGTTEKWLTECVPASAMKGGFLPRIVPVIEKIDYDNRIAEPILPGNYKQIQVYLRKWLRLYTKLGIEGRPREIKMTQSARDLNDEWYNTRPEPVHPDLHSVWKRQYDLVLKLSIINSVTDPREWSFSNPDLWWYVNPEEDADFEYSMTIKDEHVIKAQDTSNIALRCAPRLLDILVTNSMATKIEAVENFLKNHPKIMRSVVLRQLWRYVDKKSLDTIERTLVEQGKLKISLAGPPGVKKAKMYEYTWGKRLKRSEELG